jgi:tetratricopeptide (TPR) repeat protein
VIDPNPDLQKLGVKNAIPVIRTREMESVIRVDSGDVAVMGGLMEDAEDNLDHAVPVVSRLPLIGNLFQDRDELRRKTELVVFLRPLVIKNASIDGDYAEFRPALSASDLLARSRYSSPSSVATPGSAQHAVVKTVRADAGANARSETHQLAAPEPIHIAVAPPKTSRTLADAYESLQDGNLASARAGYESILQVDPRNTDALRGLTAIALRQDRESDARSLCLRILEANPADAFAHAWLAGLNGNADPIATESRLRILLVKQPNLGILHFALGNQLAAQQRWAEAGQAYFRAHSSDTAVPDYVFNLAVSLDHLHHVKEAAEYYRQALAVADVKSGSFSLAAANERLNSLLSLQAR